MIILTQPLKQFLFVIDRLQHMISKYQNPVDSVVIAPGGEIVASPMNQATEYQASCFFGQVKFTVTGIELAE